MTEQLPIGTGAEVRDPITAWLTKILQRHLLDGVLATVIAAVIGLGSGVLSRQRYGNAFHVVDCPALTLLGLATLGWALAKAAQWAINTYRQNASPQ